MKKTALIFAILSLMLVSCDVITSIKDYDKSKLDITVYANDTEVAGGFTFTAGEAWSTFVEYNTESKDWITIDPANGGAGEVTMNIGLEENNTGETRSATIHIVCGTSNLNIDIEQKFTENNGDDNGEDNGDNGDNGGDEPSSRAPIYIIDRIIQHIDESGQSVTYTYSFERENETPDSRITKVRIDGLPREDGAATVYDAYLEYRIAYNNYNIEIESYANGNLYQTINAETQGLYIDQYSYSEGIQIVENYVDGKDGKVYDGTETHTYYFNHHDHNDQLYRTDYVCETVFEDYEQGNRIEEVSYNFEWERANIKGSQDLFNHPYNLTQLSWKRSEYEECSETFSYSDINVSHILPEMIPTAPGSFIDINHMISTYWLAGIYKAYGEQQGILGLIGLIAPPSCNLISEINYMYGEWKGSPLYVQYNLSEDNKRVDSFVMSSNNSSATVNIIYKEY